MNRFAKGRGGSGWARGNMARRGLPFEGARKYVVWLIVKNSEFMKS
jgi:hypothetical protein